jgi:hypothetical protein
LISPALLSLPILLTGCRDPGGADTGPGAGERGDTSGGADTAIQLGQAQVSGVDWSLHEEIGAVVIARWEQEEPALAWAEFRLEGEDWRSSPATSLQAGEARALLLGVPYDADVTFRIVNEVDGALSTSEEVAARTGPLPDGALAPALQIADEQAWDSESRWLLLGLSAGGNGWDTEGFWKLILDRQGRVVWAHPTPDDYRSFYVQPAYDGRAILWEENTFWTDFDEGAGSIGHRMTIDGEILESFELPGMHHAYLELADGTLVWGGIDGDREVLRERGPGGEVREIWDCTAFWEEQGEEKDCDGNALFWNEGDDTLYFSSDNGNAVVEVDRASGALVHVWGQLRDAWAFAEGSDAFYNQHSPTRTPEGNLLLSTWTSRTDHEMVAREYEIDEEAQVLREVWSCGAGSGTEAGAAGEAHRLGNGNTLLNYGTGGHLREYTPDCQVVWHLEWTNQNLLGRGVFVEDLYRLAP